MRTPRQIRNQGGQVIVEAVLLMVMMMATTYAVTNYFRQNKVASKLTLEPWQKLSGMIECGSWSDCRANKGLHPSTRNRNLSSRTED